jgi:hypothetical protein
MDRKERYLQLITRHKLARHAHGMPKFQALGTQGGFLLTVDVRLVEFLD